ncbi:LacI family DNA-binding transcriptional regulator [Xylophilus sp.]|uniref:LacI family DNA-binding transcriptional regulator n=1 Tax=Xylophilus sp. TaxID=2653893 RepID=UPI0013BCF85C|nr:LacI family DNA-binding transcriptional regulator [Xylophilus sp.]KAF1049370.1 MAG: HTH-type transcriptional regulator GntR [Xylophilus sp.]
MSDVAAAAGVSLVTVSRAINSPDQLASETLSAVRNAIEQLGYVPNLTAGSLASSRSRIVGAMVPTISNAVFAETIEALTQTLGEGGYQLLLGQTSYRADDEQRLVDVFLGRRVDGVVLTGITHAPGLRDRLQRSGIPVVETWDMTGRPIDMLVGFSNRDAGYLAGEYLLGRGHRQLAFIGAQEDRSRQRLEGFRAAAEAAGVGAVPAQLIAPPAAMVDVRPALDALVAQAPGIDALFCNNDLLAAGVLFECARRGWSVPGRLAVMGFGDQPIAQASFPQLTTLRVHGRRIGEQAGQLLLGRLAGTGEPQAATAVDIGVELVVRDSA